MPSGQDHNASVNDDDITLKPVCQMSTNAARRVLFLRLAENVSRAGDGSEDASGTRFMFAAAEFVAIVNFLGSSFVHPWAPSAFVDPAEMFAAKYRVEIPTRFATDATHFVAHGRSFLAVAAWNELDSTRDAGSQIFALTRTRNPLAPWNATSVLVRVSLIQTLPEVTTARQVLYFEVAGTHTPLALGGMLWLRPKPGATQKAPNDRNALTASLGDALVNRAVT